MSVFALFSSIIILIPSTLFFISSIFKVSLIALASLVSARSNQILQKKYTSVKIPHVKLTFYSILLPSSAHNLWATAI